MHPSPSSQFEHDTQLLDALDHARLDHPLSSIKSSTVTARLRDLCAIHDLPADDGLLARATALFMAQSTSPSLPSVQASEKEKGPPDPWERPASLKDLERARLRVEQVLACVCDPEPKWKLALIFYLSASVTLPLMLHAWPWLGLVLLAPVFAHRLSKRVARSVSSAIGTIRPWLTSKDLGQPARRQAAGAAANLMLASDRQTPQDLHDWASVPANHALLAAIAASEVPLLVGDVRTLDANMAGPPDEGLSAKAKAWREQLQRFAHQVQSKTAGAVPWKRYDRVDRLSGQITRAVRAQSTPFELASPYGGLQRLALTAIREPAEDGGEIWGLWLTLACGQFGVGLRALRVRVDDQPVETWSGKVMSDVGSSGDIVFLLHHPERFLERLKGAQRLHVELLVYANLPVVEAFDVAGLDWEEPGEDLATAILPDESLHTQLAGPVSRH